ncbi:hypothetical protein ACLM5J_14600 [Nocardioides sp. Bht2]|uniref:DUF7507 domain-containing protein n=1 Tax=Nocardioides sp. Bht2 TaxID=3392297 RepID=UPI0039B5D00A
MSSPLSFAGPAPLPVNAEQTTAGAFSFVTPNGVCGVDVTVAGAAGGVSIVANPGETIPADAAGAGAVLSFSLPASPGQVFAGTVGGAGGAGTGGVNGGGTAGAGTHNGGGGGGYTDISLDGALLAIAGGGGGTGGGHVVGSGHGGDAGVPTAVGVVTPGADGMAGQDDDTVDPADPAAVRPGGGQGGQAAAPGAGGVHTTIPGQSGSAGVGRDGGTGAPDPGADTGGGGGGGYFGAGGGASTKGDGAPNHGGGGGGGGASFIDDAATFTSATLGSPAAGTAGNVSLAWTPCDYDLGVTKTTTAEAFEAGVPVRYVVTVTNHGPERMVAGDTVTITDPRAVGGTLVSATASGAGAAFTCTPAVGTAIVIADIDCSRPDPAGARGLDVGEKLTLVYNVAHSDTTSVTNTVTVTDRGNPANNTAATTLAPAKPGLALVKKANPKKLTKAGQKVVYTFRVTNTGNVTLKKLKINEKQFSGAGRTPKVKCPSLPGGLKPGKRVVCTAKYTVHKKDVRRGKIVNVATASATTPGGAAVESKSSKAVVKGKKPALPIAPNTGARVN